MKIPIQENLPNLFSAARRVTDIEPDTDKQLTFPLFAPKPGWPDWVKSGARIWHKNCNSAATITEITEKGFKYKNDEPFDLGYRIGVSYGGECYESGFYFWSPFN